MQILNYDNFQKYNNKFILDLPNLNKNNEIQNKKTKKIMDIMDIIFITSVIIIILYNINKTGV